MTVKKRDGRFIVDTIWPDGIRTRRQAGSRKQAIQIDIRIRASRLEGTWEEARKRLVGGQRFMVDWVPECLRSQKLRIREYEYPKVPPCIYFLCLNGDVVYVGQTTDLARRIVSHSDNQDMLFDRVFYLLMSKKHLLKIEAKFISALKPRFNRNRLNGTADEFEDFPGVAKKRNGENRPEAAGLAG